MCRDDGNKFDNPARGIEFGSRKTRAVPAQLHGGNSIRALQLPKVTPKMSGW
jgi:hypothetical protein